MDFEPGSRIGDYEILSVLGAGGMGKVYKVRNVLSDRVEAMKVVLPALGQEGELTERFIREIKVQASLEHPNIATLHTAQQVGGQILMIMEYVEGSSIDALLRNGPLHPGDAVRYVRQVLDALEYAHARGVVHRDIKPGNIIVTAAGDAKLMDFGIAKLSVDRKLTMTGRTLGSLYYMSPEQIQGAANVDARSDLYSLGICLYEMVTGKRPFAADSDYALMVAHLELAPTPPIQVDPTLPEVLNDIILMAIQKDPQQRFQTAAAFRAALKNVPATASAPASTRTFTGAPRLESVPAVDTVAPRAAAAAAAASAPATAEPAAPHRATSRRGLYMALGSAVTVAALVAAIYFGPRLFSSKQAAAPPPSSIPQPQPALPAPNQQPAQATQSAPASVAPAEPPAVEPAAVEPQHPTPREAATKPAAMPQRRVRTAATPQSSAPQQTQPAPVDSSARTPAPQERAPAQTPPAAIKPAVSEAELNSAREQYNQLAIRAGVAKSGLQSLQNQMGGLGLRGDMREAATRMDYLMQEARTALAAGNLELARRDIDMADQVIERIEKFLGR